jgi:hypothetical protein
MEEETNPFIKHDKGKGCSPSLVPILVRKALRQLHDDSDPHGGMYAVFEFVEEYELSGDHDKLLYAITALSNVDNDSGHIYKFLWEVAEVMDMGAIKYSRDNWMKCPIEESYRYLDAFYRHAWAYERGHNTDAESGKSHVAHAACCLSMLHGLIHIAQSRKAQVESSRDRLTESLVSAQEFSKFVDSVQLAERDRVVGALNDIQTPGSGGLT